MKYVVGGVTVSAEVSGEIFSGPDVCLLDYDDNLASGCAWEAAGFTVAPLIGINEFNVIRDGVQNIVREALKANGARVDRKFSLDSYHKYCSNDQMHRSVIESLRAGSAIHNFPVCHTIFDDKVSELCGKRVSCRVTNQIASGYFFIRIVRPFPHQDNNPPHKDVWLDRLRHALNLYFPLAGSDDSSSLAVVPGSHLWKESSVSRTLHGATVNGVKFNVPCVMADDGSLKMVRPQVVEGEGMLFSPYLIHGGAVNFNPDRTRVSLEMRFWRVAS